MRLLCVLVIFSLLGCASSSTVSPRTLDWYNSQTKRWVDSVVSSCQATHANFEAGKSPVDCEFEVPRYVKLTFPNKALYAEYRTGVAEFFQTWCGSIQAHYGVTPVYMWSFRQERFDRSNTCHPRKKARDEAKL